MKRMLLTALTASALVALAPGVASAHHGKRRGARHASTHRRHRHVRHVTFGRLSHTSTSGASQTAPTSPSSEPAGKVLSFENGVLKIALADGSVVGGKVTEDTELECRSTAAIGDQQGDDEPDGDHTGAPVARASDHGGDQDQAGDDEDDNPQACTTAALVPGAVVGAAELRIAGAGTVWEEVQLIQ